MADITNKQLISLGITPGKWFPNCADKVRELLAQGIELDGAIEEAKKLMPPPPLELLDKDTNPLGVFLDDGDNEYEKANKAKVLETMKEVLRTPVTVKGAVMPDACPAGPLGTIPVGGVVASKHIHPGMHSADICCSMYASLFNGVNYDELFNAVKKVTHFGPGGRRKLDYLDKLKPLTKKHLSDLFEKIDNDPLLTDFLPVAESNMATQGDGNHFAYVGNVAGTTNPVLVTHHGSRGLGAALYKKGMRIAEKFRKQISPATLKQNAWIPHDTVEGQQYWNALQLVREWTKMNHRVIHEMAVRELNFYTEIQSSFWNEHNFVFKKNDGLFYHAKGATPAFDGWAEDSEDVSLIPLNANEPILVTYGLNRQDALGFAPHGAGRNVSRSEHRKMLQEQYPSATAEDHVDWETSGRLEFFSGVADVTELPSAYKNAKQVKEQIKKYGLSDIMFEIHPYKCLMAGNWEANMPWRNKK